MNRNWETIMRHTMLGALLCLALPATASAAPGAPGDTGKRLMYAPKPIKSKDELKTEKDRFKTFIESKKKAPVQKPSLMAGRTELEGQTRIVEGRVVRAGTGEIFLAQKLEPKTLEQLHRMGFVTVTAKEQIRDRTIFNGELYVNYDVSPAAKLTKAPDKVVGQEVKIELTYQKRGYAMVTDIQER